MYYFRIAVLLYIVATCKGQQCDEGQTYNEAKKVCEVPFGGTCCTGSESCNSVCRRPLTCFEGKCGCTYFQMYDANNNECTCKGATWYDPSKRACIAYANAVCDYSSGPDCTCHDSAVQDDTLRSCTCYAGTEADGTTGACVPGGEYNIDKAGCAVGSTLKMLTMRCEIDYEQSCSYDSYYRGRWPYCSTGYCNKDTQKCGCGPGATYYPVSKSCGCTGATGYDSVLNSCVAFTNADCTSNSGEMSCTCPEPTKYDYASRSCMCPNGRQWDATTRKCECPWWIQFEVNGSCYTLFGRTCTNDDSRPCFPGGICSSSKGCVCPSGKTYKSDKKTCEYPSKG